MACDSIREYENSDVNFVDYVISHDPDGSCQACNVGKDSPGPVQDSEVLVRFVACPAHTSSTSNGPGPIDETLFLDAFSKGCSVNRITSNANGDHDDVELHKSGEEMACQIRIGTPERPPQPDRRYLGFVRLVAGDVRAISVDQLTHRVRVYDTSLSNNPLHADIVGNSFGLNKVLKKELRVRLYLIARESGLFASPHLVNGYDLNRAGMPIQVL